MRHIRKYPSELSEKGPVRVPVILQMEALECGAACLDMILAYFGKWVPLEQVRYDCGVSKDGTKVSNLLRAARSYRLETHAFRYEVSDLVQKGKFPCIIHWNFNHFVVLDGFRGGKAFLNDPARGRYAVTMEDLDKAFTGVVLFLSPASEFEPGGRPKSMLPFFRKKISGTRSAFIFIILTTLVSSVIGVIMPGFARAFADRLLTGQSPAWVPAFLTLLVLVSACQIIVELIRAIYLLKINGKFAIVGSSEYMWHVLRLPAAFFQQRNTGDILRRKDMNASAANTLIGTVAPLIIQCFMMVFYLVVMFRYSWQLTLLGAVSIAINLLLTRLARKKRLDLTRANRKNEAYLYGVSLVAAQLIDTIKAAGAEDGFFERWSGYQALCVNGQTEMAELNRRWALLPAIVSKIFEVLIFMGSVILCVQGRWTVGMITAFSGYLGSLTAPAAALVRSSSVVQTMHSDMERIEDVMEYPTDRECAGQEIGDGTHFNKLSGRIELKNVTFGYSRLEPPLIKDFSMTLEPGQKMAFVGPSGCGKSTIAKLITGLYRPWSGEILFDGRPMAEIPPTVFTASVTCVDQELALFEDTVEENVRLWDDSIDELSVVRALKDAQIYDDMARRKGGFQGRLAEGGKDMSGGQRQRLEIARALAQEPRILVLDEATSALDAKTEFDVVNAVRARGITCIVVAHRLSTIRDCDEIIVMSNGEIAERGTHEELYAAGGLYTRLITST